MAQEQERIVLLESNTGGLQADDINDYVDCPTNDINIIGDGEITLFARIKPLPTTNKHCFVACLGGFDNGYSGNAFSIILRTDTKQIGIGYNGFFVFGTLPNTYTDNEIINICATKTAGFITETTKIYVNGTAVYAEMVDFYGRVEDIPLIPNFDFQNFFINQWILDNPPLLYLPAASEYYDIKLFDRELTASEALQLNNIVAIPATIAPNLKRWYRFIEEYGTVLCDYSLYKQHANLVNFADTTFGSLTNAWVGLQQNLLQVDNKILSNEEQGIGNGLRFDGMSYVIAGNIANFDNTDSFSISFIIKVNNSFGTIISKVSNSNRGYYIFISGNAINCMLYNAYPSNMVETVIFLPNAVGTYHITITYNGNSNASGVKWYIGGYLQTNLVYQNTLTGSIMTSSPLSLGFRLDYGIWAFNGIIYDFKIFNKTLSLAEATILTESKGNTNPAPANIVANWRFDESEGNILPDSSGNGLHGNLVNFITTRGANNAWVDEQGNSIQ